MKVFQALYRSWKTLTSNQVLEVENAEGNLREFTGAPKGIGHLTNVRLEVCISQTSVWVINGGKGVGISHPPLGVGHPWGLKK